MKPTHKMTSKKTDNWWLVRVEGDSYYHAEKGMHWAGPIPFGEYADLYDIYEDFFLIEKINTFHGNKYGGVIWAFASKNFHTHVEQSEACRYFWKKMGVTLDIASHVESTYQTHIKNDLITSQRLKLKQRRTFVRNCLR